MGQYYNDVATVAEAEGLPIRRTFPKEGALQNSAFWAVSADSEMKDEANVFIDYTLRPDVQALLARNLGLGPSIPRDMTDLTDEEWFMVSTDVPSIVPRYNIYAKWGDWINDRWPKRSPAYRPVDHVSWRLPVRALLAWTVGGGILSLPTESR